MARLGGADVIAAAPPTPVVIAAPAPAAIEQRLASPVAAIRRAAVDEVLARPQAVDPFVYAELSQALWQDGRRLQATFWFYVFQVRTRPWADADRRGDAAGALRGSLNEVLGTPINRWVGSDVAQWQAVARRAIGYEARLPLFAGRPDGLSAAEWNALVVQARESYRRAFEQTLGVANPTEIARTRRENGLPVGPLADPGPALPETWR